MPDRDVRVCFVGDSYVAGLGDSSGLGWVGRVTVAGLARGLPLTAYNLGVRRDTSVLVSERIGREVRPRLAPASDPRVVVSFGVNDTVVEEGVVRVSGADTVAALERSIAAVAPAHVLLVGPPAVDDDAHAERIDALNEVLRERALLLGVGFVDSFTETSTDALWREQVRDGDGYHPDAAGYQRLAEIVGGPVLDWLSREAPGAT